MRRPPPEASRKRHFEPPTPCEEPQMFAAPLSVARHTHSTFNEPRRIKTLSTRNLLLGTALAFALAAAAVPAASNVNAASPAASQSEGKTFTHEGAGITF